MQRENREENKVYPVEYRIGTRWNFFEIFFLSSSSFSGYDKAGRSKRYREEATRCSSVDRRKALRCLKLQPDRFTLELRVDIKVRSKGRMVSDMKKQIDR